MTKGTKILIGVVATLGVTALFAFHKKSKAVVKKVGKLVIGDSSIGTPDNADLKKGSTDAQHVMQLQQALNQIHAAAQYINSKCGGIKWAVYPGGTLPVNGSFDSNTAAASQFYLNRQEVDLDYLNSIREKLSKYQAGDKCKYPLS